MDYRNFEERVSGVLASEQLLAEVGEAPLSNDERHSPDVSGERE